MWTRRGVYVEKLASNAYLVHDREKQMAQGGPVICRNAEGVPLF